MVKVSIELSADSKLIQAENLQGEVFASVNPELVLEANSWYKISVHFLKDKLKITDIKINDQSIGELIYTGWTTNLAGSFFQPNTELWEPSKFEIWINTNLGFMMATLKDQIANGDFGKNLKQRYLLTVDRPIQLPDTFPESLKSFFSYGAGPRFWDRESIHLPYKVIENFEGVSDDQAQSIIKQCGDLSQKKNHQGWHITELKDVAYEPEEITAQSYQGFGKVLRGVGYKELLSFNHAVLDPGGYINIHIDDHPSSNYKKYIAGPKKFYYTYTNGDQVYFKMSNVGLLPLDKPLLINTHDYSHCLVNCGTNPRSTLMAYGIFND